MRGKLQRNKPEYTITPLPRRFFQMISCCRFEERTLSKLLKLFKNLYEENGQMTLIENDFSITDVNILSLVA